MSGKILLIDDDVELCGELTEILVDEGYVVDAVHDGPGGKNRFDKGAYDLLLLDLKLPGLSGYQILRHTKTVRPKTPVIVLSGRPVHSHLTDYDPHYQDEEYVLKLADGFINKPYDIEQLLSTVRGLLNP